MIQDFGKIMVFLGLILVVLGTILLFFSRIPFIGKLPGDILVKKEGFTFYAPIATSILISLILSILLTIIFNLKK